MSKDSDLFKQPSRIDVIAQNGNNGEHYPEKVPRYAIQTNFSYGWDYIGVSDDDGLRDVYKTEQECYEQILEIVAFTNEEINDYKVVQYNYNDDDSFSRPIEE